MLLRTVFSKFRCSAILVCPYWNVFIYNCIKPKMLFSGFIILLRFSASTVFKIRNHQLRFEFPKGYHNCFFKTVTKTANKFRYTGAKDDVVTNNYAQKGLIAKDNSCVEESCLFLGFRVDENLPVSKLLFWLHWWQAQQGQRWRKNHAVFDNIIEFLWSNFKPKTEK